MRHAEEQAMWSTTGVASTVSVLTGKMQFMESISMTRNFAGEIISQEINRNDFR